jgi:hypothetical protein
MAINQLYKVKPPYCILVEFCLYFDIDLNNLDNKKSFTINDVKSNISKNLDLIKTMLLPYYLVCKSNIYLNNLSAKKTITLLRQLLKVHNYKLDSTDYYIKSKKYILYNIIVNTKKKKDNINGVIKFD